MEENYVVNYRINVDSEGALSAIKSFQEATANLSETKTALDEFRKSVSTAMTSLAKFDKRHYTVNLNTDVAKEKIDGLINKLTTLNESVTKQRTVKIDVKMEEPKLNSKALKENVKTLSDLQTLNTSLPTKESIYSGLVEPLTGYLKSFSLVKSEITSIIDQYNLLKDKTINIKIQSTEAQTNLKKLEEHLEKVNKLAEQNHTIVVNNASKDTAHYKRGLFDRVFHRNNGISATLPSRSDLSEFINQFDKMNRASLLAQNSIDKIVKGYSKLKDKDFKITINTTEAETKLDNIISKIARIKELAHEKKNLLLDVSSGESGGVGAALIDNSGDSQDNDGDKRKKSNKKDSWRTKPSNLGYQILGPSMLDSSGFSFIEIAKGMGVAYGVAGMSSLMGNVVNDAVEYNNLMQTTKNILGAHDDRPGFESRFKAMERTIRNVGMETKFTAPEVSDAGKFLAMAGLEVEDINKAINPVANTALVGDTDLGTTADVMTNIMTGYGIKSDDMQHAADIMTQTFTMSNVTLMEIAESYKYAASLLSAGGIDFEEATGALGILGDAGIKGSQAGTTMRTIMGNIVNPTKKQLKAWEEIGVERFDENGEIRDLTDIFGDLAKANISLQDFYRMFHKTAAQGAVALTAHVDKWNEIVAQNFLSEGLVQELAEEKKNTIQGLWAQITSIFTEQGLRAFENIENPVRAYMKEMIEEFQKPEFEAGLTNLGNSLLSLTKVAVDFAQWGLSIYNQWSKPINAFLEFQLKMTPLLAGARILKALKNIIQQSARIVVGFKTGWTLLPAIVRKFDIRLTKLGITSIKLSPVLQKLIFLGEKLKKSWMALSLLRKGLVLGIAAGIASLAYIVYNFQSYNSATREATKATEDFFEKTKTLNGIDMSKHASERDRHLAVITNRQLTANQALGEYIDLLREKMGLENEDNGGTKISESDKGKAWENYKLANGLDLGFLEKLWRQGNSTKALNAMHNALDNTGLGYTVNFPKGFAKIGNSVIRDTDAWRLYDKIQTAIFAYNLASNLDTNASLKKIVSAYDRKFSQAKTPEDVLDVRNELLDLINSEFWFYNTNGKRIYGQKGLKDVHAPEIWTSSEMGEKPVNDFAHYYPTIYAMNEFLMKRYFNDSSSDIYRQGMGTIASIRSLQAQGKTVSDELLETYLMQNGAILFTQNSNGSKKFGDFGSEEMLKKFGYYNGAWHRDVEFEKRNPETQAWEKDVLHSINTIKAVFLNTKDNLAKVIANAPYDIRPLFDKFLSNPMWNILQPEGGAKDTSLHKGFDLGDEHWEYKEGVWVSSLGNKVNGDLAMQNKVSEYYNTPSKKGSGSTNGTISQNDYKPSQVRSSAAPKQVIVRIENLMNVEAIDMTNPDNVSVVNNLKDQLAMILTGAVQEASENF